MTKYINTLIQNKRSHFDVYENEDVSVSIDTTQEVGLLCTKSQATLYVSILKSLISFYVPLSLYIP